MEVNIKGKYKTISCIHRNFGHWSANKYETSSDIFTRQAPKLDWFNRA